ncbi:MAG: hypothetical protein ACOCSO_00085 [Thermoplasmatota archaeon]
MRRSRPLEAGLAIGILVGALLIIASSLATIPTHRSSVDLSDDVEGNLPSDLDIVSLEGSREGDYYRIELRVEGTIGQGNYSVFLLTKKPGEEVRAHEMFYTGGDEILLNAPSNRGGDTLTLLFPMDLVQEEWFIVGLEGVSTCQKGGEIHRDVLKEDERKDLGVSNIVNLPLNPFILLLVGGGSLGISFVLWKWIRWQ